MPAKKKVAARKAGQPPVAENPIVRTVEVRATDEHAGPYVGYWEERRRRPGEVFMMNLRKGEKLPDWVTPTDELDEEEDEDAEPPKTGRASDKDVI